MIASILDTRTLFETIATVSGSIALWASMRAQVMRTNNLPDVDPVDEVVTSDPLDDLTARLRRPVRWTLANPLRALGRVTGRR